MTNADVNGCWLNNTMGAFGLHTRWYCSHKGSKGITLSHLF